MATEILGIRELSPGQVDKEIIVNEAFRVLEAFTGFVVVAGIGSALPTSPTDGDRFLFDNGSTWVFAHRYNGAWVFYGVIEGYIVKTENGDLYEIRSGEPIDWIISGSTPTIPDETINIIDVAASRSLLLTDKNAILQSVSSNPLIVTLPLDSSVNFSIGVRVEFYQKGSGTLSIKGATGVELRGQDGLQVSIKVRYGGATAWKTGPNSWEITGAL